MIGEITIQDVESIEEEIIKVITWCRLDSSRTKILKKSLSGVYSIVINNNGDVEEIEESEDLSFMVKKYNKIK